MSDSINHNQDPIEDDCVTSSSQSSANDHLIQDDYMIEDKQQYSDHYEEDEDDALAMELDADIHSIINEEV